MLKPNFISAVFVFIVVGTPSRSALLFFFTNSGSRLPTEIPAATMHICLGIEGSANKVGVGIVTQDGDILANPRKT